MTQVQIPDWQFAFSCAFRLHRVTFKPKHPATVRKKTHHLEQKLSLGKLSHRHLLNITNCWFFVKCTELPYIFISLHKPYSTQRFENCNLTILQMWKLEQFPLSDIIFVIFESIFRFGGSVLDLVVCAVPSSITILVFTTSANKQWNRTKQLLSLSSYANERQELSHVSPLVQSHNPESVFSR